jgi:hypothetical protein
MTKTCRAVAAIALLAVSLPAFSASATATRAWQFAPEANAGLRIRNLMGSVRVERGTLPGIHVSATTNIDAETRAEAERLLRLVEFRTSDIGAASRLDVRLPAKAFPKLYWEEGDSSWWSVTYVEHLGDRIRLVGNRDSAPEVRVDLVVRAPEGAHLDVSNVFGDSIAQGFSGTLRLDTSSGQLSASGGNGELRLDSGSGAVKVTTHRGRVSADTGSGEVNITDCECEIVADTGSGPVEIRKGKGSVAADTGSGGIEVEGFAGPLAADSGSGSVTARGVSDMRSLEVDTGSGDVSVQGDLSALERVEIDVASGGVRLQSTAQPSLDLHIETGSGRVAIAAPGASVRDVGDGITTVSMKGGAGRGVIDTGSGSVDIDFQ